MSDQHYPHRQPEFNQRLYGEFSVGHAGFMAIGAYVASLLTVHVFPPGAQNLLFPLAILAGGIGAALVGFLVAIPSFKTRAIIWPLSRWPSA